MSKNKKLKKRVKRLERMVKHLYDKATPKSPQNKTLHVGDYIFNNKNNYDKDES
jgi:hypothetical protein